MITRKVFGCVFPKYRAALEKNPTLSVRKVVKFVKIGENTGDIVELGNTKSAAEIYKRRAALSDYLIFGVKTKDTNLDVKLTPQLLSEITVEEIIEKCNGDLAKIQELTGLYGLAKYAALPAKKVIPRNRNIKETGYTTGTVENSFRNFLSENSTGLYRDLYERFGECGKILNRDFFEQGFTSKGLAHVQNENLIFTYRTTSSFYTAPEPLREY